MARKPPPRHAAPARPRRVVARTHPAPALQSSAKPGPGTRDTRINAASAANAVNASSSEGVKLGSFASLAVVVAGATVMTGGAHGYGPVVTVPPTIPAEVAGIQQLPTEQSAGAQSATATSGSDVRSESRLGTADKASVSPNPLPSPALGPASSLEAEHDGRPASVWIGSIGAGSELIDLGLTADGSLEVPVDFGVAGWWKGGPRPGDPGPAVITGHLDSTKGPGVFAKLGRVKPGDEIIVRRNDGGRLTFLVTRIDRYPKRAFPTRTVYGPTDAPELRVITCGGVFDRSASSYVSNIVVFAKLIGPSSPTSPTNSARA
jgi:hypothetical protein